MSSGLAWRPTVGTKMPSLIVRKAPSYVTWRQYKTKENGEYRIQFPYISKSNADVPFIGAIVLYMDAMFFSHQWEENSYFGLFSWYLENRLGNAFYGRGCPFQNKIWTSNCCKTAFWIPKKSEAFQCFCISYVHEMDVHVHSQKQWRIPLHFLVSSLLRSGYRFFYCQIKIVLAGYIAVGIQKFGWSIR